MRIWSFREEDTMKVRDVMTAPVDSVQWSDPIGNVAQTMADLDLGALPVLDGSKLVGMVTDRDIAVRAVAAGIHVEKPVQFVMTDDVESCSPETEIEDALAIMSKEQVRRLPVCNEYKELVGLVALADLAHRDPNKVEVAEALSGISEPGGHHCQPPVSD
jgi:CBS-domain-containing membrane protein